MARLPYTNFHDINLDWMIKRVMKAYTPDNPPPYPVKSVNGKTGTVQLTGGDIPFSEDFQQATVLDFCDFALEQLENLNTDMASKQDAPILAGSPGQVLGLDADQNPVWLNNPSPESIIDDNAGLGDTTKVYSADHITGLLSPLVDDIGDLNGDIVDLKTAINNSLISNIKNSISDNPAVISTTPFSTMEITPDTNSDIYVSGKNMFSSYYLGKYYPAAGVLYNGQNNVATPKYYVKPGIDFTVSVNKNVGNIGIIIWNSSNQVSRRFNNYSSSAVTINLTGSEVCFAAWIDETGNNSHVETNEEFLALETQIEYGSKRSLYEKGQDPIKYTGIANNKSTVNVSNCEHTLVQSITGNINTVYKPSAVSINTIIINIKKYGAIGDGVNDDTVPIQNALNEAHENSGGIVFVPAGTYLLNSSLFDTSEYGKKAALHIYDNTTLWLDNNAVLKRGSNVNHIIFTHNESSATGYDGAKRITIKGGVFDEDSSLVTDCTSVNISHAFDIMINGVTFKGSSSGSWHYIEVNSSSNVKIYNCNFMTGSNMEDIQIDSAGGTGNLGQDDNTVCMNIEICGCYFNSGAHPGIGNHTDAAHHDIRINGCVFYNDNTDGAIKWVASTHAVDIYDCTFYDNDYAMYFMSNQTDSILRDCRLLNVTTPVYNCIAHNNIINGVYTI